MRPRDKPLRFSPFLTDKRANRFMELAERAISENDLDPSGPDPCTCGPCGEAWTLPLPGEWIRFPKGTFSKPAVQGQE